MADEPDKRVAMKRHQLVGKVAGHGLRQLCWLWADAFDVGQRNDLEVLNVVSPGMWRRYTCVAKEQTIATVDTLLHRLPQSLHN